jgi:ABC-type proline/glycine betaine transport system substrate-binding protein
MLMLDDYQRLKRKVDAAKSRRDRLKGAADELMARLKKEFKVSTVEEAEALLADLQAREAEAAKKYAKARAEFLKKWKEKVGDDE